MKHFSPNDWADFVRRVATPEQAASMQKHLDEGCDRCNATVKAWKSVADFARQEASFEPSAADLRIVESYFAPVRMALQWGKKFERALLTFDSSEQAVVAGIRGAQPASRQVMYRSGDTFVDMRLEPSGPNRVVLAGQVLDSNQDKPIIDGISVLLLSRGDAVSTTTTNQFGEFQLSFEVAQNLQLLFNLNTTALVVDVPDTYS